MKKAILSVMLLCFLFFCVSCSADPGAVTETTVNQTETTAQNPAASAAMQFASNIKVGWNLGNTLDVPGTDPATAETGWGNPYTTAQTFQTVKAKGFNAVRIPVTWRAFIGDAPDYTINAQWLARVKEVVDYAISNDLYTIINIHHDGGEDGYDNGAWLIPDESHRADIFAKFKAVWTQIADYFEEYDEKLIFEGMNEVHTAGDWTGTTETVAYVNELNAAFVETVRATGGNNQTRFLMVPTYAASVGATAVWGMRLPEDDRLLISVHAYTPGDFAFSWGDTTTYDPTANQSELETLFSRLKTEFIDKGVPVIMGECGAVFKNNDPERIKWATHFGGTAYAYGVKCFWWDNGLFGSEGESFGLLNRQTQAWEHTDVLNAFISACTSGL